jgi:Bacterial Ig-like domain/Right handed beta helix region
VAVKRIWTHPLLPKLSAEDTLGGDVFDVGAATVDPSGVAISVSGAPAPVSANPTLSLNDTADHIVNSTESASVTFTVSGLPSNEPGTVTFTDAANQQVVVNVGGNGNFSADLSALTDGTITSSLVATGAAGHATSVSGNAVTLDTDRGLTPTVVVDAGDPANVKFTISGLEGDEAGTMTFTDTTGHSDVINIGSNGTYAANLSNLANGTVTYLVTVTDPAGNVTSFDPPISLGDGSANAPAGTPEFTSILNGYAARPAWNVAGVDYYVGTPSGTVLKNPSTISMAGVSVNSSSHVVTVSGSNVTLDGYDFSLNGGWQVNITNGANNVTVENSYFKVGANNQDPIFAELAGSITILNNTFDGGASSGSDGSRASSMIYTGANTALIEYNRFTNFPNDGVDVVRNATSVVIQYNLFDTMSSGSFHTDAVQTYGEGGIVQTIGSFLFQYNTEYMPPTWAGQGNSFLRVGDQGSTGLVSNLSVQFNTGVLPTNSAGGNMSKFFDLSGTTNGTLVNPTVHDNYLVQQGALWQYTASYLYQSTVVNPTAYNNIDMTNGGVLLLGLSGDNKTNGGAGSPVGTPVISASSIVNTSQVQLTGTAPANDTIDVYDQGVLLGTVKANTSGAWSFTTGQLANGGHSLTARATDAHANTSAASAVSNVTIGGNQTQR